MLAPIAHILPLTTVMRTRLLPTKGRVLANVGQKVNPMDTVAEAPVGRKHIVVDLIQKLGISASQATKVVMVKRGQKVAKGDLLAATPGLFKREIPSPASGVVVAVGSGKIIIETGGAIFELQAGIAGTVAQVINERGVIIRSTGALIQGVWGNGKLNFGAMVSLIERPDEVIDPARLDVSLRGSLLLAGHAENPKIFQYAADLSMRGLILASMSPALLNAAVQAAYPVLLLEGFGRRPMSAAAFKLLTTNAKRSVSLDAEMADQQNGTRPEIFVPLPVAQEPPEAQDIETFAPNQTVRIMSLLRPARQGMITQLRPMEALPNGVRVSAALVRLETGEEILAPLTNLEVLG